MALGNAGLGGRSLMKAIRMGGRSPVPGSVGESPVEEQPASTRTAVRIPATRPDLRLTRDLLPCDPWFDVGGGRSGVRVHGAGAAAEQVDVHGALRPGAVRLEHDAIGAVVDARVALDRGGV